MEVGLELSTEKTKYIFMSRHQTAGQNHNFMTATKIWQNSDTGEGQ